MPEGKIKSVFTGDATGLLTEMQKINDKVDDQKEALTDFARESSKAYKAMADHLGVSTNEMENLDKSSKKTKQTIVEHGGAIDSIVGSTLKWAAATLSVQAAFNLLNTAKERQIELAKESVDAAVREAGARENLARNLEFNPAEIKKADAQIRAIQDDFGIGDKGFVTEAFTAAQAEVPDDPVAADKITRSAAKFAGRNPKDMQPIVEGFGTLKRAFPEKSPEELEGFMGKVFKYSPITDAAHESRKVLPSVELLQDNVDLNKISKEQAAAEHIAYQHQLMRNMGDKTGEGSAEAMVRLTGRLDDVFASDEEMKKLDPGGTRARMELLQGKGKEGLLSDWAKETKESLMKSGMGEAKAKQATEGLVSGNYDDSIDKEIANLKFDPAIGKAADDFRKKDPIMKVAAEKGRKEAKAHQDKLDRVELKGPRDLADDEYKRFRDAYDAEHPWVGPVGEGILNYTVDLPFEATDESHMRRQAMKVQSAIKGEKVAQKAYGPDKERDALIKTAEEVFQKMKQHLDELNAAQKENREAAKENQKAVADLAQQASASNLQRDRFARIHRA